MMHLVPIGDLVDQVKTWNPRVEGQGKFSYIDISSVDRYSKTISEVAEIKCTDAPMRARQIVARGDVLVATVRPNLNAVATVPSWLDGATASTGFCVLRPTSKVLSSYLFHWVRSPEFVADMVKKSTGQSYPAVSDKIVKTSRIPLPDTIEEQRRIADILNHVDELRAKRQRAISLLDDLAQSIFLDMFDVEGDPEVSRRLGEVAEIVSGITKGRRVPKGTPLKTVPYLAVANVQDKRLELSNVKTIDASAAEIERYRLRKNDLLLTEGGDPDKLGRGTLWNNELPEAIHQNHIFRVRLRDGADINPIYLNWYVASKYGRKYFLRSAKQTTGIASINATQLSNFPLHIPPRHVQEMFAERVASVHDTRALHLTHLAELDELFGSLQQKAFLGEL